MTAELESYKVAMREWQECTSLIGNLLDHWDGLPNDLKSQLQSEAPAFVTAMRQLIQQVERR
jgi:hypothetical protein